MDFENGLFNFTLKQNNETKHVSFDLRRTLIKSNPEYKIRVAGLLKKEFDLSGNPEEIKKIYKSVESRTNKAGQIDGIGMQATEVLEEVLCDLGVDLSLYDETILKDIYKKTENLFLQYHPITIDDKVLPTLQLIKEKGYSMNILSNTGINSGETMRKVMNILEIDKYMDFMLFSDELGVYKPNPEIFQAVMNNLAQPFTRKEIIHVGDNLEADDHGAKRFGMAGYWIDAKNQKGTRVSDLQRFLCNDFTNFDYTEFEHLFVDEEQNEA